MITEKGIAKRLSEYISINGKVKTLGEWLSAIGITYNGYVNRLERGMSLDEALTLPKGTYYSKPLSNNKKENKTAKKAVRKFVRNGGGAGTWRWVEE